MNLFIDTSIFVDVLRKETVESSKLLFDSILEDNDGFTSSITVAELSVGAHLSSRSDSIEKTMELLSLISVINLNYKIAFHGGKIYSELIRRGLEIELNDCLIAATGLSVGIAEIVTRNIDHFERIDGIHAATPEYIGFG
ncbi:MAG: tRNA(fMet)-specific endonuclease VapC [Candidatus Argoarchaeum ethanivorans]|uniref:Ribonuclease VapC n=1 Tax=Candidatus Argoarchaeum ethanivorans TaxID=2608793 RepID=A0A811TD78_9EURY|nr:MAG: tRNA(fMet)-specific endonuclease VapC [Candidatus Argoarchaeum ethanivorans]